MKYDEEIDNTKKCMKKCLFVATTIRGHIKVFHIPYLKWFKEQGWEVHVAAKDDGDIPYCDKKHNIAIERSPLKLGNVKAYFQLKNIIKTEKYDIVHGHTPMGGVLTRLCGKGQRKNGTKIMYTAHGFHFFKGAPLINWIVYYPIEKWLSKYTDSLITINNEDYELAKRRMRAKKIWYIPGIGVDTEKFLGPTVDREAKRRELGIPVDAVVMISIGELIKRKNHKAAIQAISRIDDENLYYVICGRGELKDYLLNLSRNLKVEDRVLFLGFRTDTVDLLHMSDVFLFPSLQEGLPVALMEAMSAGLPCVVSKIRGNVDLIEHGRGGFLCEVDDVGKYFKAAIELIDNPALRQNIGEHNKSFIQKFSLKVTLNTMKEIYSESS